MKKTIQNLVQQTNLKALPNQATKVLKGGDAEAEFIISDEIDGL